jgi:hypothetical protein
MGAGWIEAAAGGGGGDCAGGGEEVLGASEVANLLTQAVLPSSSRTRIQPPFTSRIFKEAPFFTLPTIL